MYYVYLLLCADKSLYTGITNNPEKRLLDHQKGKGGAYTRSHKPVKMVYLEKAGSKSAALKHEFEIKRWKRQRKILTLKLTI
jgi:putative endonuclease